MAGDAKPRAPRRDHADPNREEIDVLKSWSTNQAVSALSSGEAEYYGIVKAASVALGIRSLALDMGIEYTKPIMIKWDARAAIGISNRIGVVKTGSSESGASAIVHISGRNTDTKSKTK